jgi:glycine C-acetyltransferase
LPPLITDRTAVISDELNHNSIINAIALGRPAEKRIYRHLDAGELERHLAEAARTCARAIIVTDGVFSMRCVHAPLEQIRSLVDRFDAAFAENALLIVDDFTVSVPSGHGPWRRRGHLPRRCSSACGNSR